jgi:PmbA protein
MNYQELASEVVRKAIRSGADEAEVALDHGRESEVGTRMGKIETLKQATSKGLGLRVFLNKKLGFAYTSDFSKKSIEAFVDKAIALARETSRDEYNGLPDFAGGYRYPDLDLFDPQLQKLGTDWKIEACKEMEETAFAYDDRINNSDGASVYDGDNSRVLANSRGVFHSYKSTYCYLVCAPVATQEGKMQTGFWYSYKRFFGELDPPKEVATVAAQRTVRQLGAKKTQTKRVPVVFDPLMSASIIASIFGALNGDRVYKRQTYLVDKLGEEIASPLVTVIDDGVIPKAVGSSPLDGEGLPTSRKVVIDKGVLQRYFYDTYTANKVGTEPTGNAQRGYSSTPRIGSWNFYLENGHHSPEEIITSVEEGLYVTRMMGFGLNMATGDLSRGAMGLWIENGELTYPVEEVTIAGNMLELLRGIEMVGNDLKFMSSTCAPTIKVREMTVSGV